MDIKTITSLFNSKKKYHNMEFEPKREQMQIASSIKNGKDTLGFFPTGFGKLFVLW
jgi:superfamily II DNA helicase RecQ